MRFERLTQEAFGAKNAGFEFDANTPLEIDMEVRDEVIRSRDENYLSRVIDGFWDFDSDLYRGNDGNYYAVCEVMCNDGFKPLAWKRLRKSKGGNGVVFNGVEFTEIEYIFRDDTEIQQGILIHDLRDENRDGDMIIGNGAEMPMTEEEAKMLLENETGSTQFHEVNGLYFIEKDEKPWYAVLRENDDNDWGTGSYDLAEAQAMVRELREDGWTEAFIAVIDESGPEPFCLDEIHEIDG